MPVIRIDFDDDKVSSRDATALSEAAQKIVQEVTGLEDVFVYANSAQVKVGVHPIEIFVEMSAHKIADPEKLIGEIKSRLGEWKQRSGFSYPVNLTLDPKPWKIELGI